VGDIILDLHDEEIEITEDLIEQMRKYEQETNKSVIWRGKITGRFLFFKYIEDHPEEKLKTKKKPGRKPKVEEEELEDEELDKLEEMEDEVIEEQVVNEENLLKDAIKNTSSNGAENSIKK